jgi:hypothetical protein
MDLDQDPLSVSLGQDITILMRVVVIFDMLMMLMWMPSEPSSSSSSVVPFGSRHASLGVSWHGMDMVAGLIWLCPMVE